MQSTQGASLCSVFKFAGSLSTFGILPPPSHRTEGKAKASPFLRVGLGEDRGMNRAVRPGDAALYSNTGVFPSEASLQRVSCRPDFRRLP